MTAQSILSAKRFPTTYIKSLMYNKFEYSRDQHLNQHLNVQYLSLNLLTLCNAIHVTNLFFFNIELTSRILLRM